MGMGKVREMVKAISIMMNMVTMTMMGLRKRLELKMEKEKRLPKPMY